MMARLAGTSDDAGGLTAGPRTRVPQALDVGDERVGTGRHGDGVPRDEHDGAAVGCRDGHFADAADAAVAADQIDARTLDPRHLAGIRPVAREGVAAFEDGSDVEVAGDGFSGTGNATSGAERGRRAQQRLRGHAGPVGAFAADELVLDDDGGEAALHGAVGDVLAYSSAAEDDEVVLFDERGVDGVHVDHRPSDAAEVAASFASR